MIGSLLLHTKKSKEIPNTPYNGQVGGSTHKKIIFVIEKDNCMQTTMAADGPCITAISTLDWPAENDLEHGLIQCAGRSYLAYESRLLNRREFLHSSSFYQASNNNNGASSSGNDGDEDGGSGEKKKKEYDLLSLSERKLKKLNYYQVLGANLPMHASTEDIRKAYHKACLKYHPDKTGRGEEDEVFLLVKAAFDTLSDPTKRRSYDSTVDFDESIPKEGVEEADFYAVYGPVFERNLRFASFNDPMRQAANTANNDTSSNSGGGGGKKKGGKKNKNRKSASSNNLASQQMEKCPPFGDDDTPLDQVHAFYEFWIHFESWRDFTLKATKETEHDVEAADSRDEKRWMKQEIDRKVKKMKKEEMARINLLVERAMAADPRLRREKERVQKEKAAAAEAKRKEEEAKAEKERLEREKREAEEAKKRMEEESKKKDAKKQREMEKKQLRKAKQLFRKLTMTAYQAAITSDGSSGNDAVWDDLEKMNDDIELLCDKLSAMELVSLSDALGGANAVEEDGDGICVEALVEVKQCAVETAAGAERQSLLAIKQRNQARKEAAEKQREQKAAKASSPWSKEELAALAKAVKKYPPGGSNRWDAIALFVNNLCKLAEPRTKEECIEKYNQVASSAAPPTDSTNSVADDKDAEDGTTSEAWTEEQDAQLQEMLRKYPADMDKNERWKAIANGIDGKSKKECVQRFKAIREAVRQGKK